MKKLIFYITLNLGFVAFGQEIEYLSPGKGVFKEIILEKPNVKVEPIPDINGVYKTTHLLEVFCKDVTTQEEGLMSQYINSNNGMVAIPKKLLSRWSNGSGFEDAEALDYWAILPDFNQRLFSQDSENGKMVMEMSMGQSQNDKTLQSAKNLEEFWTKSKKVKTQDLPSSMFENSPNLKNKSIKVDVYEFDSDEGIIDIHLLDLGLANGTFNPVKQKLAITGLGGMGWIYNPRNKHVYFVIQISDKNRTKGCRLVSLKPEAFSFSGSSYKSINEFMAPKITAGFEEEISNLGQKTSENIEGEEDGTLKALYKQKGDLEQKILKTQMETLQGTNLSNPIQGIIPLLSGSDANDDLLIIDLKIEERKLNIELNREGLSNTQKRDIQKKLSCNKNLQILWQDHKLEMKQLLEKNKKSEAFELMQKINDLNSFYLQKSEKLCQ